MLSCPECSRLEDWFLAAECDTKPCPVPVSFISLVHEELTKTFSPPSMGVQQGGILRSPRWRERLQCKDGSAKPVTCSAPGSFERSSTVTIGKVSDCLVEAPQPLPVAPQDHSARLCDSVCQASTEVQWHSVNLSARQECCYSSSESPDPSGEGQDRAPPLH